MAEKTPDQLHMQVMRLFARYERESRRAGVVTKAVAQERLAEMRKLLDNHELRADTRERLEAYVQELEQVMDSLPD